MNHKDAELPEGWRNQLLDFYLYGGPGTAYGGSGKLPPRVRDIIVHYFYLLGLNPNIHAKKVPADYKERDLEFSFIPPPPDFQLPVWADPKVPGDSEDEDEEGSSYFSARPCTSLRQLGPPTPGHASPPPPATPPSPSPPPRQGIGQGEEGQTGQYLSGNQGRLQYMSPRPLQGQGHLPLLGRAGQDEEGKTGPLLRLQSEEE